MLKKKRNTHNFENTCDLEFHLTCTHKLQNVNSGYLAMKTFSLYSSMSHQEELSDVCPTNALLLLGWQSGRCVYKLCIPKLVFAGHFDSMTRRTYITNYE